MLSVTGLRAGYDGGTVLHELTLTAGTGIDVITGHNGAGKTTLLHTIAGLLRPAAGTITCDGTDLTGRPAHQVARTGVGLLLQGQRVWPDLTVADHLHLARPHRRATPGPAWTTADVLELFPVLGDRRRQRAGSLSGGERQMLALARALLARPRLLLLDEPTEGLAPHTATTVTDAIRELPGRGVAVLAAAPDVTLAARLVTGTVHVLHAGRIAATRTAADVHADPHHLRALLAPGGPAPTLSPEGQQ